MKASQKLINALKQFEGCKLKAYKDAGYGVWTIGYGHTGHVQPGMTITEEEAEYYLRIDLRKFEENVEKLIRPKTQGQFDALVDFAYNCGTANLISSTLLKKIKAGAPEKEIRYQFSRWTKAKGKELPGLVKRRQWEANRYFEND